MLVTLLQPLLQRETDRERECVCLCAARLNLVSIKFAHDNNVNIIRMQCTFFKELNVSTIFFIEIKISVFSEVLFVYS